jgi:hypothetical protein
VSGRFILRAEQGNHSAVPFPKKHRDVWGGHQQKIKQKKRGIDMKRFARFLAASLISMLAIAFLPFSVNPALADSNQQCSQRGGSDNKVIITCFIPTITVGDVKVDITVNRLLSDIEINLIKNVVVGDVEVLNICKSTRESDLKECSVKILSDLIDLKIVNLTIFNVCVTVKGVTGCKN